MMETESLVRLFDICLIEGLETKLLIHLVLLNSGLNNSKLLRDSTDMNKTDMNKSLSGMYPCL